MRLWFSRRSVRWVDSGTVENHVSGAEPCAAQSDEGQDGAVR